MGIKKYKYYFRKPRSEIVKDIFRWLLVGGAVTIAATSPYFLKNLLRGYKRWQKYPRKKVSSTFYNLKKQGLIKIEKQNHQIYISLTEKGKKKASWFQIDALKIKRPKKWDKKWRVLIFDIPGKKKICREALRGKLKQLGFRLLQKSVWIHAFDCQAEMELLREFFGLSEKEMRLVVAEDIGNDSRLKKFFKLSS